MAERASTTQVAVMGRLCADLYPEQLRTPLSEVETFRRFVGGFAGNVATGLARLGVGCTIVSGVGDDGHGEYVRAYLEREGVDCTHLVTHPTLRTALAFCEAWPPDRFPITFYRTPTCPDWELRFGRSRPGRARRAAARARDRHRAGPRAEPHGHARSRPRSRDARRPDRVRRRLARAALGRARGVPGRRGSRRRGGQHRRRGRRASSRRRASARGAPRSSCVKHGPDGVTVHQDGDGDADPPDAGRGRQRARRRRRVPRRVLRCAARRGRSRGRRAARERRRRPRRRPASPAPTRCRRVPSSKNS